MSCNNVTRIVLENKGIRFKWNVDLREQFRSGVYDSLQNIISIVDNVDCSSRDSVNSMLNEFSEISKDVADPLFSKSCYFKNKTSFKAYDHINDWFDHECVEYRKRYLDALKVGIHVEMPKAAPKKSICHLKKLEMILK